MNPRLDYRKAAPDGVGLLSAVSAYNAKNVDAKLRALVELRVSQINGCAYCLNLHTQEARHAGEDQQRLDVLSAWRETMFFSEKEQAALAWAEAVTQLGPHGVAQEVYDALQPHFTEKEIVDLTLVIVTMNAWNRISIAFGATPAQAPRGRLIAFPFRVLRSTFYASHHAHSPSPSPHPSAR